MIAQLKGLVDGLGEDWAVVDVGGVGYLVFCSGRTLGRLAVGDAVSFKIDTHVREDQIALYGFLEEAERQWFRLLNTVQGVGARVALGILGALTADELMQAIAAGDKAAVTRAPGVGPKLAQRILSELKDKAGTIALGTVALKAEVGVGTAGPMAEAATGAVGDAVSALVNLGYSASQALTAVSEAARDLGGEAPVQELIRGGLARLAPSDAAMGGSR